MTVATSLTHGASVRSDTKKGRSRQATHSRGVQRFLLGPAMGRAVAAPPDLASTALRVVRRSPAVRGLQAVVQTRPELCRVQKGQPGVDDLEEDLHEVEREPTCVTG